MPRRVQTKFPDWWTNAKMPDRIRERLRATFSITRDGYTVWYKGAPRFVAKSVPPAEVEAVWAKKRDDINKLEGQLVPAAVAAIVVRNRTYREVLAEYLTTQKARIGAPKRALSDRTYFNYVTDLNNFGKFVHGGRKVAGMPLAEIGPAVFSAYARKFGTWKASGFDSVVVRVGGLFVWAVAMEYIDRYRPGPDFRRPAKGDVRDQRIQSEFALTAQQVADAYKAANVTLKCWVALGTCAGFINSDVAHVTRSVINLETGIVDFRRRKTGRVRRVIPLPPDVVELLRSYRRPDPAEGVDPDLFFLTEGGQPYSRTRNSKGKPSNTASVLMGRLLRDIGAKGGADGRGMKSFRTTFYNLAPKSGYDLERKIVMGRAQGTIDTDHYLEDLGVDRLRHVVTFVWDQVRAAMSSSTRPGSPLTAAGGCSAETVGGSDRPPAAGSEADSGSPPPPPAS